jgi:hypothetical protein
MVSNLYMEYEECASRLPRTSYLVSGFSGCGPPRLVPCLGLRRASPAEYHPLCIHLHHMHVCPTRPTHLPRRLRLPRALRGRGRAPPQVPFFLWSLLT